MRPAPPQKELFVRPAPSSDTVFVNDRVCFQTEEKQRVVFVHGVAFPTTPSKIAPPKPTPWFCFSNRDTQIRTISHAFVVGVPGHPAGSGKAASKSETISCASFDGRRNYCDVDTQGANVRLTRQIGMATCVEGSTWGYDRRGVWVDRGCNEEFLVQAVSEPGAGDSSAKGCAKMVGKQVANELVKRCLQVAPGTHAPCKAQNSCKVMEDEIQRGCELLGANAPAFCGENK